MLIQKEVKATVDENQIFAEDISEYGSYLYTYGRKLSSRLATFRTARILLENNPFAGKSVLDIGCGDGFFSRLFYDQGKPTNWTGIDRVKKAIKLASESKGKRKIRYLVGDAHRLPWLDNRFDLILIQSTLHHDNDPQKIIKEAFRVGRKILIHEPNGNNPGLKIIEKISKYHLRHHEKSYKTSDFIFWIKKAGGEVENIKFAGFVPMFCPDWLARIMKLLEPVIEKTPLINRYFCAVTVISASKIIL